ncbi:glucan biosynthesis protein G [Ramlibacter henchirensis]|uniref:Glucans biosynthesis protein G n=1 Tax=Ramlibacter henchirensis TaxID=204072 RepID=A0A4Z0C7Z9_9BURK|nr:glucan biosynthesis protein G [Ramlibacter henchirensis]TFZ06498.1 glucan biosynthesis protein G [Ramlibacter henchirensis]
MALFLAVRLRARCLLLVAGWLFAAKLALAQSWGLEWVAELARSRAAQPLQTPASDLPPTLAALDYDGLRDIRFRPDRALWRDAALPFETMFFHRGRYHPQPVRVHEVLENGQLRTIPWRSGDYDYGRNTISPQGWPDLGHAGLRVHYPLNNTAYKDELIVFLGASYFRALGAGQQYGLSARGLAIDTAGASGPEEFPRFTEFWIQRPQPGATELVLYALLESPRATGAYRFVVRPGKSTVVEVTARVFLRAGVTQPIATLGIAPLTSMFLAGENQPRPGDFRPEVHDSDGLLVESSTGEWLWRPLQNPDEPVVTSFSVPGVRGFGLMQRDRAFASYEDTEARYERRPSAWVRPIGDWGPGRVELLQLPTPDETHDNIAAYWVPARLPAPGEAISFAYELHWQGDEPQRPAGAWAVQSRRGLGYHRAEQAAELAGQVQYVVDFAGPALDALPSNALVRAVASSDANGRIEQQLAYFNPASRSWRMTLRVRPVDPAKPVELRAFLQHGNETLSETWTYIVLPDAH